MGRQLPIGASGNQRATRILPLSGLGWTSDFRIEGTAPDEFGLDVRHRAVTSGYFRTMGVPVSEGKMFIDFDRNADETSYWYSIVAVVGNERMEYASEPQPEVISHLAGDTPSSIRFVVKTALAPAAMIGAVRAAVAEVDSRLPFIEPRSMNEVAADALIRERFLMTLFSAFALVALTLTAVGVYGVSAHGARARTREIGIRMALGATSDQIARQLLVRAGSFVVVGVATGLVTAAATRRLLSGWLFGVARLDLVTWVAVCALLAAVGLAASYLPARRAARTDPAEVMRAE